MKLTDAIDLYIRDMRSEGRQSDSRPVPRDQALGRILVDLRSAFAGLSWETAA